MDNQIQTALTNFISPNIGELDFLPTIFSFFMCIAMSFILREFYIKRSFSLTGKMHIGSIIPILSAVVFLVILVVKSSLALSLGLVGALSIVRFRTPIKEPEELVYLFLAIAIGLGYAAGQTLITTVLVLFILIIIFFWLSGRNLARTNEYNLIIQWTNDQVNLQQIYEKVLHSIQSVKLIRLDQHNNDNTAVLLIAPYENTDIDEIVHSIKKLDQNAQITFFEAKTNW